ncbi:Ferrous iron transport protein B/50S ribosome-binding GTPase [Novymonas esmeraldas]|uniref:Ferrous iron transport protein B/50S ribosome-binding GTPase n=1 Tax=Novymonas esmeraldas TaxID=1808958 RepID=A0AAW0EVA9_9TRYP
MSASLGKALQRSKRATERQGRRNYRDALENERNAVLDAALHQEEAGRNKTQLKSIWETNDLENFLSIADAREEGYFAERDVRVVIGGRVHVVLHDRVLPQQMPADEAHVDWLKLSELLTIPRRPAWDYTTSPDEVQAAEKKAFVDWRRSLAQVEEEHKVLLTPYERNLEVWRQLWRVAERADVVAVIVDARNPLMFRCADFEAYVRSTQNSRGEPKRVLLLLNKSDLLTEAQRRAWAAYFQQRGDLFFFFSAKPLEPPAATAAAATDGDAEDGGADGVELTAAQEAAALDKVMKHKKEKTRHKRKALRAPVEVANAYELAAMRQALTAQAHAPKVRVEKPLTEDELARDARATAAAAAVKCEPWTVLDPVQLLDQLALLREDAGVVDVNTPLMVGLVGYPNVGKSSTINAIIGCKKVVVSATPGKTKHFQTLTIPNERRVALCDCPGLVFPSFATTKAQMVCDGILPVDTATDTLEATATICRRLPRPLLEEELNVSLLGEDDVDESDSLAERLLNALARRRGYMASHDRPNRARAGKELLKLYVDGYLVYAEPPPTYRPDAAALSLDRYVAQSHAAAARTDSGGDVAGDEEDEGEWVEAGEDLDSEEEEAWADLDSADEARALSEPGDIDDGSVDMEVESAAPIMFFARPHALRNTLTRYELFNSETNEARVAALQRVERRRRRRTNHQLEPDESTFVNRHGEVELRLDDDDGVLELVTATGGPVRPATKAKTKSKRQQRRELKHMGVGPSNRYGQRKGVQDY